MSEPLPPPVEAACAYIIALTNAELDRVDERLADPVRHEDWGIVRMQLLSSHHAFENVRDDDTYVLSAQLQAGVSAVLERLASAAERTLERELRARVN